MNMKEMKYGSIDILKFILAIMIVILHIDPMGSEASRIMRYPILLFPLPLFFMSSSFLFFVRKNSIQNFVKRNLRLYLAWFVFLLPITWHQKEYWVYGWKMGIQNFFLDFFLSSTFRASWFIMALVEGMLIVYTLSKCGRWSNTISLVVGMILYGFSLMVCEFGNTSVGSTVINAYPRAIWNSFPVSIIWISIGKICAEKIERIRAITRTKLVIGVIVTIAGTFIEYRIVEKLKWVYADAFCIMLGLSAPLVFCLVLRRKTNVEYKSLRNYSTVLYCSHLAIGYLVSLYMNSQTPIRSSIFPGSIVVFSLSLLLSWMLFIAIKHFSKKCRVLSYFF